jgi:hypothetical protein
MTGPLRRTAVVAGLATALVLGLVGCSDQEDVYCEALAEEQDTLSELAESGSGEVLDRTLESMERLRGEAPDELRDEWDTVVRAYRALARAVDDAGVDPGDYDPEDPPPGVSKDQARRLAEFAGALRSPRVIDASLGIEDHAGSVCDVDFSA